MIDLQTFSLAFFAEAALLLLAVLGLVLHTWLRNQRQERQAAGRLIAQLQRAMPEHGENLQQLLEGFEQLPAEHQEDLIADLLARERRLYQQILNLFLSRDPRRLGHIESHIRALQEPYQQLLQSLPQAPAPAADPEALAEARARIRTLEAEVEQLADQLQVALETLDNLSSEYTRMFAPDRSREELEASRRRIMEALKRGEEKLRPPSPEEDDFVIEVES